MTLAEISARLDQARASVKKLMKDSPYKLSYFWEGLGLVQAAFYRRYRDGNWELAHLLKIEELLSR